MLSALPKPVVVLAIAACLAAPLTLLRSTPPRADVVMWLQSSLHAGIYAQAVRDWTPPQGGSLAFVTATERANTVRLLTMFMGGRNDAGVPDLVQIEISTLAPFLRPPADGIGLLPLDRYLDAPIPGATGATWRSRLLPSRVALAQRSELTFAVPFDLHPIALAWRHDLWNAAGIDLDQVRTWDEFHAAALAFEAYWRAQGTPRAAFAVKTRNADQARMLLAQRGVDVATDRRPTLTSAVVADTVRFYAELTAGTRAIGSEEHSKTVDLLGAIDSGQLGAFLCPDWRAAIAQNNFPKLRGLLRLRPLPLFAATDARTSTFGGQVIAITRACRDPDRAWAVIERMLLSATAQQTRMAQTAIMPPMPEMWPAWAQRSDGGFFSGTSAGVMFSQLAPSVPVIQAGPASRIALDGLRDVLDAARHAVNAGQSGDALLALIRSALAEAQQRAERRTAHEAF